MGRLPAPLAAQLTRLATRRHRITRGAEQRPAPAPDTRIPTKWGKSPNLRRKGKPMQSVRPWNDQTGHLPDWLVGTRTQLWSITTRSCLSSSSATVARPAKPCPIGGRTTSSCKWNPTCGHRWNRTRSPPVWNSTPGQGLVEVGVVHVGVRPERGLTDSDFSGFEAAAHLSLVGVVDALALVGV